MIESKRGGFEEKKQRIMKECLDKFYAEDDLVTGTNNLFIHLMKELSEELQELAKHGNPNDIDKLMETIREYNQIYIATADELNDLMGTPVLRIEGFRDIINTKFKNKLVTSNLKL